MKFSLKLMLSAISIIAVLFSAGSTFLVARNFDHALQNAVAQNTQQHLLERYAMESNMLGYLLSGEAFAPDKLAGYAKRLTGYASGEKFLGLYAADKQPIYQNLPAFSPDERAEILAASGDAYVMKKSGGQIYMLLSSELELSGHPVYLVSAYGVTGLFDERDRQIQDVLLLDGIIILIAVTAVGLLSHLLTKPLKTLNTASQKIAAGAYQERTRIRRGDEIGQLSRSFDQMAEAVETRVQLLGEAVQNRDDFIAAFSHELKTPMTAIIGYSDLLRTAAADKEKQLAYAKAIYHEGKRLEALAGKMMELMAVTEDQIDRKAVSIQALFTQLSHSASSILGPVSLVCDAEPATVLADQTLLDCLLRNLLTNAKKARPTDQTVRLTGRLQSGGYRISVMDHGCGMPKEALARITEPFYMVDKSRSRAEGGSGLGLAICQKIARLHRSELHFESEPGAGTTVWLELEVAPDETI